jgi:hypothetical protein
MGLNTDWKEFLSLLKSFDVDFIANKRAVGRPKDLADIEAIE